MFEEIGCRKKKFKPGCQLLPRCWSPPQERSRLWRTVIVIFDENSMHGRTIYINDQNAVGDIMFKKTYPGELCTWRVQLWGRSSQACVRSRSGKVAEEGFGQFGQKKHQTRFQMSKWNNWKWPHRQNCGLLVEVDGVHDDEDLLVLVSESTGLLEGSLAVVLHPAVLAQEGGGKPDGQTCNWQWYVGNG